MDVEEIATEAPAGEEHPAGVPAPALSREEMRERIRSGLAEGRITVEDVLADMAASMYWTETQIVPAVTMFFGQAQGIASSRIGRRLFRRAEKIVDEEEASNGQAGPAAAG